MKSGFRYFCQLILLFVLVPASFVLPFAFATGTNLTIRDNSLWFVWFELLCISAIVVVLKSILTEVVEIEVLGKDIVLRNIITKQVRIVGVNEIIGFRRSYWSELFLFIGKNNKTVFKIKGSYYRNLDDVIEKIGKPLMKSAE
jgi:hypothetical protein